jgi:hypothetical protein
VFVVATVVVLLFWLLLWSSLSFWLCRSLLLLLLLSAVVVVVVVVAVVVIIVAPLPWACLNSAAPASAQTMAQSAKAKAKAKLAKSKAKPQEASKPRQKKKKEKSGPSGWRASNLKRSAKRAEACSLATQQKQQTVATEQPVIAVAKPQGCPPVPASWNQNVAQAVPSWKRFYDDSNFV